MIDSDESLAQPTYGIQPPQPLPDGSHVGAVHLQVENLRRSVEYYTEVLGMQALEPEDEVVRLGVAGIGPPLVVLHGKAGVSRVPRDGRFGLYHFAVLLPDRAALGRFAAHLLGAGVRPGAANHAVSEALYLTDPDGLGIEVYADRPRSSWAKYGQELVMVTEPLDVEDVIAAAEGETWKGLPSGTVMGHVHLHVGDLGRAEAFYHVALGFDKTVWSYPGALFLSAGGYHHHLATNTWSTGPSAGENEARLLEWELIVPSREDASAVARRLAAAGHMNLRSGDDWLTTDPWGTRVRIAEKRRP